MFITRIASDDLRLTTYNDESDVIHHNFKSKN